MTHRKADRSKRVPATEQMAHLERTLEASIALMKRARRAMLRSRRQQPRDVIVEMRDELHTDCIGIEVNGTLRVSYAQYNVADFLDSCHELASLPSTRTRRLGRSYISQP